MGFRPPPAQPDFNKLRSILLTSEFQIENNPLYQVIRELINAIVQFQGITNGKIAEIEESIPTNIQGRSGVSGEISGLEQIEYTDEYYLQTGGDSGSMGPAGPTGPAGITGSPGLDGIDGEEGPDSLIPGPIGPTGNAGATGVTGPQGIPGPPGLDAEEPEFPYIIPGERGPAGSGGSGSFTVGTATLNFGVFPGSPEATVDVTGQAGFVVTSKIFAQVQLTEILGGSGHTVDDIYMETPEILVEWIADGSFRITGRVIPIQQLIPINNNSGRITGVGTGTGGEAGRTSIVQRQLLHNQYNVSWGWSN